MIEATPDWIWGRDLGSCLSIDLFFSPFRNRMLDLAMSV